VAAETGAGWVAMHMPADPSVMQRYARYDDVVAEVTDYLVARADKAAAAGVSEVWIDPGIGFGKNSSHNLALLRHLDVLVATGWPVLVGTSRKSFLGHIGRAGQDPRPPEERLEGTVATSTWAVTRGAAMVRVHDVRPTAMAVRLMGDRAAPAGRAGAGVRDGVRGRSATVGKGAA
jgi:dihydropteroate synthase